MKYRKNKVIVLLSALILLGNALSGGTAFSEDAEAADPGSGMLFAACVASVPENQ